MSTWIQKECASYERKGRICLLIIWNEEFVSRESLLLRVWHYLFKEQLLVMIVSLYMYLTYKKTCIIEKRNNRSIVNFHRKSLCLWVQNIYELYCQLCHSAKVVNTCKKYHCYQITVLPLYYGSSTVNTESRGYFITINQWNK